MADPLERITNLLALLLETRVPLTLQQIGDRLGEVYPEAENNRRQTFERDKALLRSEGVPIEQTVLGGDAAGQTAYWIDRNRYELGDFGLTDDERGALQLAVATVHLGTDWGEQAIWKLGGGAGAGRSELEASLPSLPALPQLFQAARDRSSATFTYRALARRLDPYSLLARNGLWYVVGLDREKAEVRTYRVDRIEGGIELGEPGEFVRPEGFDPQSVFPSDSKKIGGQDDLALVRVSAQVAPRVEAEVGADAVRERHADGSLTVEVPCASPLAFRLWVVELLEHAEVLAPPAVRAEFVAWLEAI